MTGAEYECKFEPAEDTPYLTLTGELWGVFCGDFGVNRSHYNGTALKCFSIVHNICKDICDYIYSYR